MVSPTYIASMQNTAVLAGGWALIVGGIIAAPIPGPFSIPAVALGGLVLARRSPRFRRNVATVRAWFPGLSQRLTRKSASWPRTLRYVVLRTDPRRCL